MLFTPSRPNILNIPMEKPYLSVSNKDAIGGGCGFGPQTAIAPISKPQKTVSRAVHINTMLNLSFTTRSVR